VDDLSEINRQFHEAAGGAPDCGDVCPPPIQGVQPGQPGQPVFESGTGNPVFPGNPGCPGRTPLVGEAIEAALPERWGTGSGQPLRQGKQLRRLLFKLAQHLQAALGLTKDSSPASAEEHLAEWFQRATERGLCGESYDDVRFEFEDAWKSVKVPAGQRAIDKIIARVRGGECQAPQIACRYQAASVRLLVATCAALSRLHGGGPFYLGCEMAAEIMGVSTVMAASRLRGLCRDRDPVLKRVKAASYAASRAAEYLYLPDQKTDDEE